MTTFAFYNCWAEATTGHEMGNKACPECDTWWHYDFPRACENERCAGIVHVEFGDEFYDEVEQDEMLLFVFLCDQCGDEWE